MDKIFDILNYKLISDNNSMKEYQRNSFNRADDIVNVLFYENCGVGIKINNEVRFFSKEEIQGFLDEINRKESKL